MKNVTSRLNWTGSFYKVTQLWVGNLPRSDIILSDNSTEPLVDVSEILITKKR